MAISLVTRIFSCAEFKQLFTTINRKMSNRKMSFEFEINKRFPEILYLVDFPIAKPRFVCNIVSTSGKYWFLINRLCMSSSNRPTEFFRMWTTVQSQLSHIVISLFTLECNNDIETFMFKRVINGCLLLYGKSETLLRQLWNLKLRLKVGCFNWASKAPAFSPFIPFLICCLRIRI